MNKPAQAKKRHVVISHLLNEMSTPRTGTSANALVRQFLGGTCDGDAAERVIRFLPIFGSDRFAATLQ